MMFKISETLMNDISEKISNTLLELEESYSTVACDGCDNTCSGGCDGGCTGDCQTSD